MKQVWTTAEIAELLDVAERIVNRWFDSKRLPGYRDKGTQERCVQRNILIEYLEAMDIGTLTDDDKFERWI